MAQDITRILRSLHESAVNRCRERIDEAALRAKGLISRSGEEKNESTAHGDEQYGVTSVLKRRNGL